MKGLLLLLTITLSATGCIMPAALSLSSDGVGRIGDGLVEHAVDYGMKSKVAPFVDEAMPVVQKHFGSKQYAGSPGSAGSLGEGDTVVQATPAPAAVVDDPEDTLYIVRCHVNMNGVVTSCEAPERVKRKDWAGYWQGRYGAAKWPNGVAMYSFKCTKVDRAKSVVVPGKGPKLPTVYVEEPTSLNLTQPFTQLVSTCACGCGGNCGGACGCDNCSCSQQLAGSSSAVYTRSSSAFARGNGVWFPGKVAGRMIWKGARGFARRMWYPGKFLLRRRGGCC
jgi:hypothetical protein